MKDKSQHISREVFDHLVNLAALALTEEETNYLLEQMNRQLGVIEEIEAIPIPTDLPLTTHGVEYGGDGKAALREDAWVACQNADEVLAQAPQVEHGYIVVPDIPTQELE